MGAEKRTYPVLDHALSIGLISGPENDAVLTYELASGMFRFGLFTYGWSHLHATGTLALSTGMCIKNKTKLSNLQVSQ